MKKRTSLKNIIGGDILATDFFRRQAGLLFLIMVLIIIYINNRYECQLQLIEIDNLKKELIDIKYDALTRSSELMERSRQSRIEEYIATKESDLQTSTNPPYLLKYGELRIKVISIVHRKSLNRKYKDELFIIYSYSSPC